MRLRLLLALVGFGLLQAGTASAYPWPLKPFHRQHPVRANFGDPRTRFMNTMLTDGLEGPGLFQFHNGIDIYAPNGTPVYPVASGRAWLINDSAISVRTKEHRTFQYYHLVSKVGNGQHVVAGRTVLGYVLRPYEHVHLTEIRGHTVWNPVARGGISPYRDGTTPQVESISARPEGSLVALDPARVCGTVSIVAAAQDTRPTLVPGPLGGFPVAPALVTWRLERIRGPVYVPDVPVADFRRTLPLVRNFWDVYARGTFQNSPRFSNRQFFMPGRYLYNLASSVYTPSYPNGVYEVTVRTTDMRGNGSEAKQRFTISNHAGTADGCQEPSSAPYARR
jgi:murein DD-endopeptidase MepM/ murein hydrolase activator NlpD